MGEAVYFLCGMTSLACALLLFRAYRRSRLRMLLWSMICFVGLTINNCLLFIDLVVIPDVDLGLNAIRGILVIASLSSLVYGLIWDAA